ncbi:MAG: acetolactate synthase, large subunit, biosynthetic type [Candidatus Muproteobacteria bacterium RIFCSPHIGHO2_01_FULL_65_16]|uniref:Acetolactate synthase n=3 Tax=Candidatus Muproteobacteria TaxID=1817795 RepID=A0A1F6TDR9_9PROT|nr:MAG: acetolactate synthase, large subunit, biosynthetic type [Candidatus Muproteobacteria bacterium RBG_16_65_31]OGI44636.1 MAG: acetolactate synthase, large subunit, biosynthetic type [Candidatus Muproteobacteria bacterium RIFCSPHIGHO2_01_FULL_65_16]OGI51326.1 MAG: acetolactate synthase, large subunit, biosynthetic type [Candidatus Muproteobacteria bacterium RIFCSPHIGHO2_02_FULL_65_16]
MHGLIYFPEANVELNGADILVRCLQDEGVEYIFGYPGGAALHIYDALYKQDKIKHILVRHEQGAAHAADGYARSTGRPGVVLVTSGPGATNIVTGIATAYMDSSPVVVFTGQVATDLIGNDAFQEVDAVGITRPCVKHNFLVKDVKDLAATVKKAFYIATTGRPGPVLVDLPKDVTAQKCEYEYPKSISLRSYNPVIKGHPGQIKKAVDLILSAKRPMVYTGGGIILGEASAQLTEFVRLLGYPITQTLMGLGAFPATDPLFLGMLGMHGTYEANMAMHECDVLVAIGARFDDRVTGDLKKFCPHARIIHVDIDPASISKNVPVEIPIVGNAAAVLEDMIKIVGSSKTRPDKAALEVWWERINEWRGLNCLNYDQRSKLIKPQFVVEKLHELTRGDAYVTSDVGQHQMFTAQFYKFDRPRRWISSGGLGTMGFGLPAAMGVQMAHPQATVCCVTGEASIQMCIQELSTCKQFDLPLKIVNLNNRYMGMVRQWQEFFYDRRYSHSYLDALPDFIKLAEAYGHVGMKIEKPGDVEGALREALKLKDRLVFMDFITDQTENVYPMIPAGKGHNEMQLKPCEPVTPADRELA